MAIDREKVQQAAQKLVEKKKYKEAVLEYQKITAADPNDARTLLKIGDLQSKLASHAEAVATYESVAKLYANQGFALKAIAVYKQIREIIAKDWDAAGCTQYTKEQMLAALNAGQCGGDRCPARRSRHPHRLADDHRVGLRAGRPRRPAISGPQRSRTSARSSPARWSNRPTRSQIRPRARRAFWSRPRSICVSSIPAC